MIYELRIYHMNPGKMPDIHRRFESVTLNLFQKHNIHVVDFWEDAQGKEILYYVIEYPDMEARNDRWNAFANDPDWVMAKAASEVDGPIVARVEQYFMTRAAYFKH